MHKADALPLVAEQTPMGDALLVMTARSFGVVGITDVNGKLSGIITDGDLRRNMTGLMDKTAKQVMHAGPRTIRPDALAAEALGIMNDKKITCLFAVDDHGKPAGLIHIHDCLRAGVA
jgi:arabinose-5-phosphate isomerase